MAEINLLKQKGSSSSFITSLPGLVAKLLILGLIGLVGYYGWLFVDDNKTSNDLATAQAQIAQDQQQVSSVSDRQELYVRQQQLQQVNNLSTKHLYWSYLLPALAKVTFNSAAYSNIQATKDGDITVSVTVPDLESIDKFIQVFDLPEFTKNFNNLRMGAFHKSSDGDKTVYTFDAQFNFNPSLLKLPNSTSPSGQ